jgi:hypothetical protein
MNNFEYCNPTCLVFGKGEENRIGALLLRRLAKGDAVLVVYGAGSVVRSGLLDRVHASLKDAGLRGEDFGGAQVNPTFTHVADGIAAAREKGCKAVLAVGGGSTIDTAKGIAAGVPYAGCAWDFFTQKASPKEALPVACILTLPAAGSEQSIRCVISHEGRKLGLGSPLIRPFLSVINPELFFTLPKKQIRAGVIDMMSHIFERYFTQTPATDFISGQAEAAVRCIMKEGLEVYHNPKNYDAWAQVGLAGSFAHNGYFGLGQVEDWACHAMEHELSAWDESITHGEGLAVIIPAWMKYVWRENPARFVRFAENIIGIREGSDEEKILRAIACLEAFYKALEAPVTLKELGADAAPLAELAKLAASRGAIGNFKKLTAEDALRIYELAR